MRVVYVNPFSQQVSGPDESLLGLLRHLGPLGIEAHVVLPADGPPVERYRAVGATVHFAPLAILHRQLSAMDMARFPLETGRGARAVARIAREVGAELIHTNMEVVLDGALAARALGLPHVLHYRGNTLAEPRLIFAALTRLWTGLSAQVFCISHATAQAIFGPRGGAKVQVIYNPIEIASFAAAAGSDDGAALAVRAQLGAGPGQRLIGTVGRIHPRKDVETFVRACAAVARERPEARFVVVGVAEVPVEEAYFARVKALAAETGVADRLVFAGARRDMPAVMRALDVFVLSSRHEGFGRVVGEAMAAGRPVVVTNEGALPELIEGDRCGLAARAGDGDDFAAQILRLLRDPALGAMLGERGRQRASAFDAGAIAAHVATVYRSLLAPASR
ncbi:MAG TPA: glycosyltransferase family 4 protein [Polyangia bacterium]|nr:glycosyltransferase family 4 protein [Polyangia bacterium]